MTRDRQDTPSLNYDPPVDAIKVGGEWHAVEDETTGQILTRLQLTEQCDSCGGHDLFLRIGRWFSPYVYACESCGSQYETFKVAGCEAVWPSCDIAQPVDSTPTRPVALARDELIVSLPAS